ncbi:recombinase family protein [Haematobacter missouriensis]|uniref:recombinase family protein n=1 Tax=Haematobacter missouriensis TaxID=366616 RepID=UPI0023F4CFB4|nr:recombinase family protein [Haematobacter missouriensis]
MLIGYARTSTLDQEAGLEAQKRDLTAEGCTRIFEEQVSSVDVVAREQLTAALGFIREGDTLVVTKLDRLARSTRHLMEIVEALKEKGARLRIMGLGLDTSTPTGNLMLTMLGSIAQFEREIMLERQREGIARARKEGKYKGRKATARAEAERVKELHDAGVGGTEIARKVGIGRASVYRILKT